MNMSLSATLWFNAVFGTATTQLIHYWCIERRHTLTGACVCMCVIKGFELIFYSGKMTHKCKKIIYILMHCIKLTVRQNPLPWWGQETLFFFQVTSEGQSYMSFHTLIKKTWKLL